MSAQITRTMKRQSFQSPQGDTLPTRRRVARPITHPLRLLLSVRLWTSLAFILLNMPLGLAYFLVLFTLLTVGVGMLSLGIGFVLLALVPPLTLLGASIERRRAKWLLGSGLVATAPLRPWPPTQQGPLSEPSASARRQFRPFRHLLRVARAFVRHSWALAHERDLWRALAYMLLLYPLGALEVYGFKAQSDVFHAHLAQPALAAVRGTPGIEASPWVFLGLPGRGWVVVLASILVGMLWLVAEAYLITAVAQAHRALAAWMLGPSPRDERARLEARVRALDQSRIRLLDAVLLERQRIERDLHDGAQQRLVALALDLGMAREKLATQPEAAARLIAEAHEEAKRTLADLRNLVRGIHPAVLTDRGLDAALSALAARSPVPVTLTVDLPERPAEAVEATAYFAAAEALTNIAKHSGATEAHVEVGRVRKRAEVFGARESGGDRLRLSVSDNGQGGAHPAQGAGSETGTGLAGLADRVAALDGHLSITSPPGGPTTLVVDLPWTLGREHP